VIDRSSMNAWEDKAFLDAVKKTGRKRLIFGALYTEICLAFPVVDALKDGYEATFVVDAVGGLSQLAHRTAIERLTAAGAIPNTSLALVTELFRDWKSPVAGKAREIIKAYLAEVRK
jgi:nicotinamidase-related amidase